jgi:hypothetical protein
MAIGGRLDVLVNVTNDPARLEMALAEVAAAERDAGPVGPAGLYPRMIVDGLIGTVCGKLSFAQFAGTRPELVYFDNGVVRGMLAQADADRTAHACEVQGAGQVSFRWSGAPDWRPPSGTARGSSDLQSASVIAFVFDLSTLTPDDLARGRTIVKQTVDTLMQFASAGLQTYHVFAVSELGKTTSVQFTGDRDKTFAALDSLVPGLTVLSEEQRQQSLQRVCAEMPRSRADVNQVLKSDAGFQALQRIGMADDWRVVPTVAYFGPRSLHAVKDVSFDPRCVSPTGNGPGSLMFFDFVSREILGSSLSPRWVGVALRLAERPPDSPVTLSLASTMFDNGSVSLHVRNETSKAIRSMTLAALVTPVGSTTPQTFTRSGPATRIAPGASVDLSSGVIDPISFSTLGKQGASAIVGVVAVEFEDGTRWTGDLKGGQ